MTQDPGVPPTPLDALALALQQRRVEAGSPSYAEIVTRIATRRRARGVPDARSRPGRTTVYDAFSTGRRRMDTDLVLEIVRALGADETETARWADACRQAHRVEAVVAPSEPAVEPPAPVAVPVAVPDAVPAVVHRRPRALALVVVVVLCAAVNQIGRAHV